MVRLSFEKYAGLFESKGYKLISTPKNTKEKVECCDKDGYKYLTSYDGLRDSRTKELSKFKKNNPFKAYNMRLYVSLSEPNSEILMKDEELIETKGECLIFKCSCCGSSFKKKWEHYTSMERKICPDCNWGKAQEQNKVSFSSIKKLYKDAGFVLISEEEEYKNRNSKLTCVDRFGFKFSVKFDTIKIGFNAIERYAKGNPFALENLIHYIKVNKIECKPIKRVKNDRWEFECSCGNIFEKDVSNFLHGSTRCSDCAKTDSQYSLAIKRWLEEHNISYIKEYRFEDCRNKRTLPFDFAINKDDKLVLIEVDGQQHFYATPWKTEEDLQTQKLRDKIKDDYCKEKGHTLVRLPYWIIKKGSYEQILTQTLLA